MGGLMQRKCILNPEEDAPDPSNWHIIKYEMVSCYTVAKIHYPNCTNFEGDKILVLMNVNILGMKKHGYKLDPHFNPEGPVIARFKPTALGWADAIYFAKRKYAQDI